MDYGFNEVFDLSDRPHTLRPNITISAHNITDVTKLRNMTDTQLFAAFNKHDAQLWDPDDSYTAVEFAIYKELSRRQAAVLAEMEKTNALSA